MKTKLEENIINKINSLISAEKAAEKKNEIEAIAAFYKVQIEWKMMTKKEADKQAVEFAKNI